MADESSLLVPLASNADALLAGPRVEDLRRRLKQASINFDSMYLETGRLEVTAGSGGGFRFRGQGGDADFQTEEERGREQGRRMQFSVGLEDDPGRAALAQRPFMETEATISWNATLEPFRRELPAGTDWIHYVSLPSEPSVAERAREWSARDHRSDTLRSELPLSFVRKEVIEGANGDLSAGVWGGAAVMQDAIHQKVVGSRFESGSDWRATGFCLPILVPETGDLDWDSVLRIRRHRAMQAFRKALREVELRVLDDATSGDVEAAVHRAFARYQAEVAPRLETLPGVAKRVVMDMTIGTMMGVATSALAGPVGIPLGAAVGAAPSAVQGVVGSLAGKRRRWDTVYAELVSSSVRAATEP
ncbi:MAG: hypothetical protein QM572_15690 [Nocardioides sp.]|uniref:hypothetical protein n=1 Tax=Nocardioides sp. TaxID=35761 RepID=UPI0039E2A41F